MEASIQWHAYEVQKTLHVCLYLKLLKSYKTIELFALEARVGKDQEFWVQFGQHLAVK
jgi:hypothetical protein